MPQRLPQGWIRTTLGKIAQPSRERVLPAEAPSMLYVGLENIEPHTMRLLGHGYASEVRSSSLRFSKGDVLYGKMRPYLNKVWVAEFDGLCSAEFIVFPRRDEISSKFLAARLNSEDFVGFANSQVSGERPRVGYDKLSRSPSSFPPAAEQQRIVEKLNAALSSVGRAESASNRVRERLQRYREAVLGAAVRGELTRSWREKRNNESESENAEDLLSRILAARRNHWEQMERQRLRNHPNNDQWRDRYPEATPPRLERGPDIPGTWAWASVEQLAAHEERSLTDGPFGSNLKTGHYTASCHRVVRLQNIGDGFFIDEKAHISQKHYESLKDYAVHPGDLVIRALGIPAPPCLQNSEVAWPCYC